VLKVARAVYRSSLITFNLFNLFIFANFKGHCVNKQIKGVM